MAEPTRRLLRAAAAAVLIVIVLIGVPVVLIVLAGWPLPTKMPDWNAVYWAVRQGDVAAEVVIKTFACVAWLAWAQIAWALVWELVVNVPRSLRGHADTPTPLATAPASRLARRLVTAAMLLTAISSTPATSAAAPALSSLTSPVPFAAHDAVATVMIDTADTATAAPVVARSAFKAESGDTLWDIAEVCFGDGSHVDAILECNPDLDPARPLRQGQIVELPAGAAIPAERTIDNNPPPAAPPDAAPRRVYTAVAGDTLWDITQRHYGHADNDLVGLVSDASGIENPSLILVGQQIVLPELTAQPDTSSVGELVSNSRWPVHVVVAGDTVWDIAESHYGGVDADLVWAIAGVNNLANPSVIAPGDQITLPPIDTVTDQASLPAPAPALVDADAAPVWVSPAPVGDEAATVVDVSESAPVVDVPVSDAPASGEGADVDVPGPLLLDAAVPTDTVPGGWALLAPAGLPAQVDHTTGHDTTMASAGSVSEVHREDMLNSRWLFGTAAVSSLGLFGAWMTIKRKRNRRRRWLGLEAHSDRFISTATTEHTTQADVVLLADLVNVDNHHTIGARAVLLGEHPEIRFRDTPPDPPAGWDTVGLSWVRGDDDRAAERVGVLSSALVTVGHGHGGVGDVVLDLAHAGTVSVTGDRVAVERLMCSMLWELASDPLGHPVDLHVVGLACAAARHATNPGLLVSLDEAIAAASNPRADLRVPQVFLVDPFADDTGAGSLRELVDACSPGSGRAVVVAGPCEQPVEEISVPSAQRAVWDNLTLTPPQLPEHVDIELDRMLESIAVGRRDATVAAVVITPDPEAEAVALRSSVLVDERDNTGHDIDDVAVSHTAVSGGDVTGNDPTDASRGDDANNSTIDGDAPVRTTNTSPVELPEVLLSVCGRQVGVQGYPVPHSTSVLFVLAAAQRAMHVNDLSELTGYAAKTISSTFPVSHDLIDRDSGTLRLVDEVRSDHQWAIDCVRTLADVLQSDVTDSAEEWMMASFEALQALAHAPFAVLPTARNHHRSKATAWGWVDDFPEDVPARAAAETDIAQAALALSELWLAAPATHHAVSGTQLVDELCRLAATIPFARVVKQVRDSQWATGAECLLSAAARIAGTNDTMLATVQQTARALAAREQLEASDELADEIGL